MHDLTDHNRLAEQHAARFAIFEAKARGDIPHHNRPIRTAPAASVAIQGATSMTTETIIRPLSAPGAAEFRGAGSLFKPATNTSAYLKMGIMGKQGAGKTKTAGKVAIGLIRHLKEMGISYAHKPVAMFDTETGSDYLIPDFEAAGIPFVVIKTKTLADLVKAMDEAEQIASALIIDSITHPYRELIAAYLKTKNRTFLQIDDWNYLKGDYGWNMFTRRYINSKLHIIMCGRAGDDLEQYTDENGKRQLEKVGVKMKTEAETGFEPSLLVEMKLIERNNRDQGNRKRTFINQATIVKDRWDKINGDVIDDPDFADFLPHVALLNIGGAHVGVQENGDSQHILKTEKRDWSPVQRKIVLGEIQDLLVLHAGGQTAADKQRRITLLKTHFGCGYVEIEETMPLPDLRAGYDSLHQELEKKPSRYGSAIAKDAQSDEINDSLPDGMAPLAVATAAVTETLQPAAEAFDEPKWLAELTRAFEECVDFVSFGEKQQTLMAPVKPKVSPAIWKKAVKLATARATQLLAEQPSGTFAAAAAE